ncbi:hypothetical protein EAS64_10130 [Trebonia kvetii]|uniref:Uncharacterized protein n=1 Tax=Trebonia kvetii TaxID=2480626 RepID=A0A6P2C1A7_9ACTN|nr:hypothetical protein [Trebonia kvetii]TVZ04978.1 hypothetical protein EAS64_10130 [Trebonia kvetii]
MAKRRCSASAAVSNRRLPSSRPAVTMANRPKWADIPGAKRCARTTRWIAASRTSSPGAPACRGAS